MKRRSDETPERGNAEAGNSGSVSGQTEGGAGNGAEKPADNQPKPDSGATPQGGENAGGKKKIRRPDKAGKKLFVGDRLIQFDEEGVVELDDAEAAILLSLKNGYEEA